LAESTRDIKRRIKGITSTKQITKAMEMVASAKLRKARGQMERSRPYYQTVLSNIQSVLSSTNNIKHPFLEKREVKNSLYIVLAADRGLAGGYNANIFKLTESKIKHKKEETSLIVVGIRAREYFKRRGYNVVESFVGINEVPTFADAQKIAKPALEMFLKKEVDEINLVFTDFVGTLSYVPTVMKILPSADVDKKKEGANVLVEFEPSPEEVLDHLIPEYIKSTIFGALIESSSSEQAARRFAMSAATENAEEMIDDLQLNYNRARQAAITMELSEIVTGAEALK
jgi:F-type H+-transporting ATPase subunit gamma